MRLFVAAYPPIDVALRLLDEAEWVRPVGDGRVPIYRPTAPEQVHLTLLFIGDRSPRDVDAVVESATRAASGLGAAALTPQRLRTLPARGPARLIAAETDAPAPIRELHDRLVTRLAARPRPRSSRAFLPHLTLGRFRAPAARVRVDEPIDLPPFDVREIRLMRSTLTPVRARHDEVATVALS